MQRLFTTFKRLPYRGTLHTFRRTSEHDLKQTNYRNFLFRAAHTSTQGLKNATSTPLIATTMAQPLETFGNYDLVKRVKLDFTDVVVSKWKSRETGLTVIHLDYEGKSTA